MTESLDYIDLKKLELDTKNPRLPEGVERTPEAMLNHIALTTSIEDLMNAIAENGFFPGEPLIAVKEGDKYIVVEGNRRLTAVKLIHNPYECERPSSRMIEIADGAASKLDTLAKLPVIVRDTRAEILPYLGFRHITGVKQWEPLAKARYIEQLFELTSDTLPTSDRYHQVARAIGSRKDHIKRSLDALAVYKVMEDNNFYDIEGLDEESIKFSILSTALADEKIGFFVGISEKDEDDDISSNDVIIHPEYIDRENTKELTIWLYKKDESGKTKVGESRNLRMLSSVIDDPKALTSFRNGADLKVAYQLTENLKQDFISLLYKAESALIEAAGIVATIDYNPEALEVARRLSQNVKLIGNTIKAKKVSDDEDF
ncbi:chromosome partitioning protein ParB [Salmonella enterica]|nr:chromosome partitioning protein ParB [Salmonella enterica]HEC5832752.1 ParB-like nuclease domain-containing protein [Salmonella enterica subsp. enterica serovar Virchow]EBT0661199.1 chromosome partitioning protein ParB [Salmonella enterica]EHI1419533.1 ParB N-terminal domain-containing protein [Salmonella enterica]EHI4008015.1 ParB N-terminal domain-containing protein [Salmonella enterica]